MVQLAQGEGKAVPGSAREAVELAAVASVRGGPGQERRAARREHHHIGAAPLRGLVKRAIKIGIRLEDVSACLTAESPARAIDIGAEHGGAGETEGLDEQASDGTEPDHDDRVPRFRPGAPNGAETAGQRLGEDRKSTRLNSSHVEISYAVFCLKK